jgi:hypothetical protein
MAVFQYFIFNAKYLRAILKYWGSSFLRLSLISYSLSWISSQKHWLILWGHQLLVLGTDITSASQEHWEHRRRPLWYTADLGNGFSSYFLSFSLFPISLCPSSLLVKFWIIIILYYLSQFKIVDLP